MPQKSALRRFAGDRYYRAVSAARPLRQYLPHRVLSGWRTARKRSRTNQVLAELAQGREALVDGPVLVDGMAEHPNHWLAFSLFRAATGLANTREVGLVGPDLTDICRDTFHRLGVSEVVHHSRFFGDPSEAREQAREILGRVKKPGDILSLDMPFDFPTTHLYDIILKRQRTAVVDLSHGRLEDYLYETLQCIHAADELLKHADFKLLVTSHATGRRWSPLAWRAAQLGIPTVLLRLRASFLWCKRMRSENDFFDTVDRPSRQDLDSLDPERAAMFAEIGGRYLEQRREGQASRSRLGEMIDLGADLAYGSSTRSLSKQRIVESFGWSPEKPIVAIFAPNWFDYPHWFGFNEFRDSLEWLEATVAAIEENTEANWLLRAHPTDVPQGGVQLADLFADKEGSHIRMAPMRWHGQSVQDASDGFVTTFGTIGIEAAHLGKPVLLSEKGWYSDCGFACWPGSRQGYLDALKGNWWSEIGDRESIKKRARMFAAGYFCYPDWQGNFVFKDSRLGEALYDFIPGMISDNREAVEQEIEELRDWYFSGTPFYHRFKIGRAETLRYVNHDMA
jgi:hypothetical protein